MIVISGALVIVALGLLIAGLVVSSGLVLVYASIGVSVLSAVFLFLGVRQRRGDEDVAAATTPGLAASSAATAAAVAPAADPGPVVEDVRRVSPPREPAPVPAAEPVEEAPVAAAASSDGDVYVVPGRPRYHAAGCRYLSGRDTETRSLAAAQAEGFTACGVCRPDESTTTAAGAARREEPAGYQPPAGEPPATGRRRTAQTRKAQADSPAAAAARAQTPVDEPRTAPGRAVAAAEPATPTRGRTESVIVIPERGRFHRPECRYVRDVEGAREMTKTGARRQGYSACGVCKP